MPAAVIRRTVAVIRLRDRLGRCARDRTGGDGGTYYGRMTSRRERLAHACRRDTAADGLEKLKFPTSVPKAYHFRGAWLVFRVLLAPPLKTIEFIE